MILKNKNIFNRDMSFKIDIDIPVNVLMIGECVFVLITLSMFKSGAAG